MNILVTDGETRSSLAVVRSLGRQGHRVYICASSHTSISSRSKFASGFFFTTNPEISGQSFFCEICKAISNAKIDVIVPVTEASIFQLNRFRNLIPPDVILACPITERMDAVSDKASLVRLADACGIPTPKTIFVADNHDFFQTKHLDVSSFPAVVKPAFSKKMIGDCLESGKVMYANDPSELCNLYKSVPILRYPSLIQELVVGPGIGLFSLFHRNQHLALFSHKRIIEKPPTGGVSVLSESIPLDSELVQAAEKLLTAVSWEGIAMVEFKRDLKDGRAKLMEINGRFWGSLQLPISAGIDFPKLCLDYYLGSQRPATVFNYCLGFRLKWLLGILDHLLIRMRNNMSSSISGIHLPTTMEVVKELLTKGEFTVYDVYDPFDWKPFIFELFQYGSRIINHK